MFYWLVQDEDYERKHAIAAVSCLRWRTVEFIVCEFVTTAPILLRKYLSLVLVQKL